MNHAKAWVFVVLRWIAVLPSIVAVYLITNVLVSLAYRWQLGGEDDKLFFVIPARYVVPYLVGIIQAFVAPWAAVKVAHYVAPTAKLFAAIIAAALLVGLAAIGIFVVLASHAQDATYPTWFLIVCLILSLCSACYAVHEQYEESIREKTALIQAEMRDIYRRENYSPVDDDTETLHH